MQQGDNQSTAGGGVLRGLLSNPGFLPCLALLVIMAVAYRALVVKGGVQLVKLALPLQKRLDDLDHKKLHPYALVHPYILKQDLLDELGTNDYIQWLLSDKSIQNGAPEQLVNLFVTYYTGKPGQVPHVPDACYLGSGYKAVDQWYENFKIPALGQDCVIPVQVLEFERSALLGGHESKVVIYTFHGNGQFCPGRRELQKVLGNPLEKYAYFSKLEVTFGSQEHYPTKQQAVKAAEKFFQVIVPVLVKEHWPDWEAAHGGSVASQPG